MNTLRKFAPILGTAALLVSLIGCSAASTSAKPSAAISGSPHSAAATATAPATAVAAPAQVPSVSAVKAAATVPVTTTAAVACTGTVLLTDGAVTTGASALTNVHDATPTGTMKITGKARNTVLAGKDVNGPWNDPVSYWMPFSGGVGFHDSPWQTFPLGSPLYTTQGSHGCVHLPLAVIAEVYDWAQIGTLVTVRA